MLTPHEAERADEALAEEVHKLLPTALVTPLAPRVGELGVRVSDDAELSALGPSFHGLLELELEVDLGPPASDGLGERDLADGPAVQELVGDAGVVRGEHAGDVLREREAVSQEDAPERVGNARPCRRRKCGRRAELRQHDFATLEARLESGDGVDAVGHVVGEAGQQAAGLKVGASYVRRASGGRRADEHERADDHGRGEKHCELTIVDWAEAADEVANWRVSRRGQRRGSRRRRSTNSDCGLADGKELCDTRRCSRTVLDDTAPRPSELRVVHNVRAERVRLERRRVRT